MSEPLEEGDLVRMDDVGPVMSLQTISDDGRVGLCVWFDEAGVLRERSILLSSLKKATGGDLHPRTRGVSGS